jgi:hypothetical protein
LINTSYNERLAEPIFAVSIGKIQKAKIDFNLGLLPIKISLS